MNHSFAMNPLLEAPENTEDVRILATLPVAGSEPSVFSAASRTSVDRCLP